MSFINNFGNRLCTGLFHLQVLKRQKVARGEVLLTSVPFVYLVNTYSKGLYCDHCLKKYVVERKVLGGRALACDARFRGQVPWMFA